MTTTNPNRTTNSDPTPAPYIQFDCLLIAGRWVTGRGEFTKKRGLTIDISIKGGHTKLFVQEV